MSSLESSLLNRCSLQQRQPSKINSNNKYPNRHCNNHSVRNRSLLVAQTLQAKVWLANSKLTPQLQMKTPVKSSLTHWVIKAV
jgi:hypothetical protein